MRRPPLCCKIVKLHLMLSCARARPTYGVCFTIPNLSQELWLPNKQAQNYYEALSPLTDWRSSFCHYQIMKSKLKLNNWLLTHTQTTTNIESLLVHFCKLDVPAGKRGCSLKSRVRARVCSARSTCPNMHISSAQHTRSTGWFLFRSPTPGKQWHLESRINLINNSGYV